MHLDLLTRIKQNMPKFSKGQKLIGNYIITYYDKAAFMTASKLGSTVGVSESTVVRFATELGFDGYPSLQKDLRDLVRNKLTTIQRMEVSSDRIGNNVFDKVLNLDMERIRQTLEEGSRESFNEAVDAIINARNIYIIGTRSSYALAVFLAYYLNLMLENVKVIQATNSSGLFEQIMRIGKDDLMIGISFPRYSKHTVKALKYAKDAGADVLAITDTSASPLVGASNFALLARSDMVSFVDSLVAPLSVINALIVALGTKKREQISQTFETLENIWDEYDEYEKPEEK
ncbi:MAG: MurR/RpiR family transcriptional regulator [Clostridiales bacterium]|nr:MurR/RpiR family transcriptional regulator [Clostridiales bacterium]